MNPDGRKRVLGIVGSPRRNGNTEILVDSVLRGAEQAGAVVEKILLGKLDIRPCRACNHCRETGTCIQKDGMPAMLELVKASDVYVFGTPIYFMGPSAQLKTFIDRWYALGPDGRETILNGRRVVIVAAMENGSICMAHHAVGMLSEVTSWGGMELIDTVLAAGVDRRGEVRDRHEILQRAYRAGQNAVNGFQALD